jgi:GNAT superfamily N-acetyltransferase
VTDHPDIVRRDLRVVMTRPTLGGLPPDALPPDALPPGYALTPYAPGDERHWVAIHERADQFNAEFAARFRRAFAAPGGGPPDPAALTARQVYLRHHAQAAPVGTATAWYDAADRDADGTPAGRVHWVALVPAHQGRGLAKPLLAWVLARLVALGHRRAYLATSTARVPAINLYRRCGFRPAAATAADRTIWRALGPHLRPPLAADELP